MELPIAYINSMKKLLADNYEAYEESLSERRYFGLRVNTLKISVEDFLKICPFSIRPVPFIKNGFYYEEENNPAKHPYYHAGLYYLQEPSAMTPAQLLPIRPGDRVLDLCAAPGGKSTELAAKLNGTGFLLANDISNSRAKALLKNLELFGVSNMCVTSETPEKLLGSYTDFFDKILVDAPCSGEGMFRKDSSLIKSWMEHGPDYYASIQKQIILVAASMLAPGGMLLYSTCTFSEKEDEDVIAYLLSKREDMKLIPIEDPYEKFEKGRKSLDSCIRIYPHKIQGEGHFIALLQKEGEVTSLEEGCNHPGISDISRTSSKTGISCKDFDDFMKGVKPTFDRKRIHVLDDRVYYMGQHVSKADCLRYLRTGLYLGNLKKDRFEPSQAFAMTLKKEDYDNVLDLSIKDDRVLRYLKGETISLDLSGIKGYCLVLVDGFPLGFGKINGQTLKNKYNPGWRWQ